MTRLENSLDAQGDMLDFDEKFRRLENHVVPEGDEDKARYMLTDRLRSLIYSSGESLV